MGSSIPQVRHFQTQPTADPVVSQKYVKYVFFSIWPSHEAFRILVPHTRGQPGPQLLPQRWEDHVKRGWDYLSSFILMPPQDCAWPHRTGMWQILFWVFLWVFHLVFLKNQSSEKIWETGSRPQSPGSCSPSFKEVSVFLRAMWRLQRVPRKMHSLY